MNAKYYLVGERLILPLPVNVNIDCVHCSLAQGLDKKSEWEREDLQISLLFKTLLGLYNMKEDGNTRHETDYLLKWTNVN